MITAFPGPRLSEKFREKFTQWNKEFFVIQRSSLHTFPQEFQNMLQKFSNGFLREQSYKSHPLAISYSDEGASQADDTRFSMSPSYSPVETTVNHVLQAVTSIEQEDSATQTKLNLIYKRAIDSGYSNYDPESNDLEPIVDFSTSPKADLQMLIQLLSADDPETIDMMNPSQLLGRLLRYVPRKLNSYLRDTTTTDQASNAQCGQCHTRFRWSKHQLYTCAGCENKFCKSCPPNSKQMYGFGSSIEVFVCHSCLEKVYHEHAKEWLNRAHAFIEGGNLEDLKATFGCIQIAVSLFRELNLTTIGKKLLRHNYPELALPFAISAQQQASTTIETVKANHFLSSVLKSLAATHTDPNVSWELLLGAKEAALVAKMEADNLDSQIADAPSLQTAVDEINQQLHLSKAQKEDEEEKKLRTQKQEIEGYWSSRNLSAMINLIRSTKDESEHAHKLEAFEKFMQTMETYISKMLPDDRYSLIFFRGVLKLLKKRYAEGISDIEQVVWQSHSVELLKTESINIILSLLTNQPSIFTLQGLHKICMHPRMLLSKEKLPNDCMRELQLITLDETEITPPFPRRWPELSVSGLNLRAHRKCEAAFDKQIQEKKWGPQDVGYAYIDYIQGCHHPAEIIVSVLHSSMWFLKDLKENKSLQQCEKFALKKLIFSLLGLAYVTAHRNSHPGMQLYVGRSALAVALETIKTVENVAEEEDTQLISSLLHMVTYNSRFVPFWNCPSVPVSEAALLSIISAELHSKYLDQLKETDKKQRPMSEAELQYQLYENDLRYVHRAEEPENLHTTAMKELLAEKGWKMSDVSSLMTSPLTIRDRDGWIIQQPKLGQEQEFAEVKGLMINLDHENPSIELVVVPADDSRGRQGTCSQTDFRHVLSMVDEANGALFFSLDQPDDQKKFHPFQEFRYTSESIYKTDLLHTLFETDYLMKSFSVGADVSSKPPFKQRSNGEGLTKNLPKRLQEKLKPVSERGTTQNRAHRFWIQADNIDYTQDQNNGCLEISLGEMEMIIRSHPLIPGEDGKLKDTSEDDDPDSPEAKFAEDMTEVYNELGLHFPMFLRLRQLAKLQVLGTFIRSILLDMKEKSEGKGVEEIQCHARQSYRSQIASQLDSFKEKVGTWPAAEDESTILAELNKHFGFELNSDSQEKSKPYIIPGLEKRDEHVVSQFLDAWEDSSALSRSQLDTFVRQWLRRNDYYDLLKYLCRAAPIPTKADIISFNKQRYLAFSSHVKTLSMPNNNPNPTPCKWVPAALHKEEDDNHLSLCYGGVLIAPKVKEVKKKKDYQNYAFYGICMSDTSTEDPLLPTSKIKIQATSGYVTPGQHQTQNRAKTVNGPSKTKLSTQSPSKSENKPLNRTRCPTKTEPAKPTTNVPHRRTIVQTARNYIAKAFSYKSSLSNEHTRSVSFFGIGEAIAVGSLLVSKFLQIFGDNHMKADNAWVEALDIARHNPNCKCGRCALNKIAGIKEFTASNGVTFQTTNIPRTTPYCVYMIVCKKTGSRYIGMTTRKVRKRLMQHLRDIKNNEKTPVAKHFNKVGCTDQFEDYMTITVLASVSSETMKPYTTTSEKEKMKIIMQYVEAHFIQLIDDDKLLNSQKSFPSFKVFDHPPDPDNLFSVVQGNVNVDGKCFLLKKN